LEIFRELGSNPADLRVTGGGSRSDIWNQIIADACHIPLKRGDFEESTAIGAAILAAYGTGQYQDVQAAANSIAIMTKEWDPDSNHERKYDEMYELSRKLYALLDSADLYRELDGIRQE